jgi:sec-independent protein translocase protein TatA
MLLSVHVDTLGNGGCGRSDNCNAVVHTLDSGRLGLPELLIIFGIVVLLFGVGRISKISGELGNGLRNFREGLSGTQQDPPEKAE